MKYFNNLKRESESVAFEIKDIDKSLANGLRRTILSEVPSIAFRTEPFEKSDVNIKKNTCNLHNEFLAHRIGMIPIYYSDISNFDSSRYRFVLSVRNDSQETIEVTSNDFNIYFKDDDDEERLLSEAENETFFPKDPISGDYIPICKLKPILDIGEPIEEIDIECRASVSNGLENARYCPVSKCVFYNKVDVGKAKEGFKTYIKNEVEKKRNIIRKTGNRELSADEEETTKIKGDELKKYQKAFNNHDMYRYFETDENNEPTAFIFEIETIGQMTPEVIYSKSFDILINKLEKFAYNLENEVNNKIEINQADVNYNGIDIIIKDENHTLGNLLQSYLYKYYIQDSQELNLVGYKAPHPLVNEIILRISCKNNNDNYENHKNEVKRLVKQGISTLLVNLNEVKDEWNSMVDIKDTQKDDVKLIIKKKKKIKQGVK
tara:strand:- start:197 stop:1498 length:1302 start_codon:yes stop_codon:yes gene_type:complete